MGIRNVLYRLPEIKKAALEFPAYAKHFSIRMAGWHMIDSIRPRTAGYMNAVYKFIGKNCCDGIVPPASKTERTEVKYVWTCWWQGMENAPHIVKRCINQMKKMLPYDAVLHVITLENYREYVDIPTCISEKFEKNLISPAHFSDFLRFSLLYKYGGLWLDSTVFCTDPIPAGYFESVFFTQKDSGNPRYENEVSKGLWCGFVIGGQAGNPLFAFLLESLQKWWETYDIALDYVLFDYIIKYAYEHFDDIQEMIDEVPSNNPGIWNMYSKLNWEYSEKFWCHLCTEARLHKLTYRREYTEHTDDGKLTLYGYIESQHRV